ncbi:MAG: exodeoxyribonuclease VII large subunit [Bacteroidia bacterium]|nr:exodeoxyribonuclease VII large subunit [Bacteroidia bacterium]
MEALSLYELNRTIKEAIDELYPMSVWVKAEISRITENRSGHCYLELVEKDSNNDEVIAKASASIWKNTYKMLAPYFAMETGTALSQGMTVLIKVKPVFHEVYSYSLNVTDIDPTYTIGDIAQKRKMVVARLKEEFVFDMNRELNLSRAIRNIALVSSKTAAGYEDFINQLNNQELKFNYNVELFEAVMQGDLTENSIINALDDIISSKTEFDIVVIVRGGGAVSDLHWYDSYRLSYYCTQYPLPIITGIGHDRDVSVLDMIAYTSLKTPTAAAQFIVNRSIFEYNQLKDLINDFSASVQSYIKNKQVELEMRKVDLKAAVSDLFVKKRHNLSMMEQFLDLSSPSVILKKGYSISLKDGKVARFKDLHKGDCIMTMLFDGSVESIVK